MFKIKMLQIQKRKSFTLIELIIVVFIGTLIILATYSVYQASYLSYKKNYSAAELTQNARIALERTSRELRQTNEILENVPPTTSEIKFQNGHVTDPSTNHAIQYIRYYRNGTDLYRQTSHYYLTGYSDDWVLWSTPDAIEEQDLPEIKAQNISDFQFILNGSIVTIDVIVADDRSTYSFETKTLGRNIQ